MTASERAMAESEKDKPAAKPRKKREGMSCLDAAAKVLAEAGEPMNTKAMVEAMTGKGYWTTKAPTPHATLSRRCCARSRRRAATPASRRSSAACSR